MRQKVRDLNLRKQTHVTLAEIALKINSILQGWLNYYGRYCPSALVPVWRYVNTTLVAWVKRKYKRYKERKIQASLMISSNAIKRRNLFMHWRLGKVSAFASWKQYETRVSSTILREAEGEIPSAYSPNYSERKTSCITGGNHRGLLHCLPL